MFPPLNQKPFSLYLSQVFVNICTDISVLSYLYLGWCVQYRVTIQSIYFGKKYFYNQNWVFTGYYCWKNLEPPKITHCFICKLINTLLRIITLSSIIISLHLFLFLFLFSLALFFKIVKIFLFSYVFLLVGCYGNVPEKWQIKLRPEIIVKLISWGRMG